MKNRRGRIQAIRRNVQDKIIKIVSWFKQLVFRTFGDVVNGIAILLRIFNSAMISAFYIEGAIDGVGYHIILLLSSTILFFILLLLEKIVHLVAKHLLKVRACWMIEAAILHYYVRRIILIADTSYDVACISAIAFTIIEIIFCACFWAVVHNKKKNAIALISCFLMIGSNLAIVSFFVQDGFEYHTRYEYSKLIALQCDKEKQILNNEQHQVMSLDYGIDDSDDVKTDTVDLSRFTSYDGKMTEWVRKEYWGYDLKNVPMKGRVWYPMDSKNNPVLFIIHGNHTMITKSYLGYTYLGEYLASQGYVVVSVDQASLNGYVDDGLLEENDARAILLLENIKQVLSENEKKESPLYQIIDSNNIAIAGHSRGGEAVAAAKVLNDYSVYPDQGQIKLNYHFNIKTIVAIAPTCDQYKPGDREIKLEDVNYFLLHGSNDMDVTEFLGMKQYNNVKFTGKEKLCKSYLYIAGANHGQFNTEWGKYDVGFPASKLLNVASLISMQEQQEILKTYLKVCLDVTLKQKDENKDMLFACEKYTNILPKTVYVQGYKDSTFQTICDYEEDSVINTGTLDGTRIEGRNLNWSEHYTRFTDVSDHVWGDRGNYAVKLFWKNTKEGIYQIQLNEKVKENYSKVQFDIASYYDSQVEEKNFEPFNCEVNIIYQDNEKKTYQLYDYKKIYPPFAIRLGKLDYLFGKDVYKHHFQTVILPIDDKKKVKEIQFCMNQSNIGRVMLDNIGFSK